MRFAAHRVRTVATTVVAARCLPSQRVSPLTMAASVTTPKAVVSVATGKIYSNGLDLQ